MKRFHLHNRFEDKLKYKVEDFELVPSESIWDNVEAELNAASKKKGKLVAAVLTSSIILFSAVGLYLGGVFDSNTQQLAENANDNVVATPHQNIPTQPNVTSVNPNTPIEDIDNNQSIDATRTEPVNANGNDVVYSSTSNTPRVTLASNPAFELQERPRITEPSLLARVDKLIQMNEPKSEDIGNVASNSTISDMVKEDNDGKDGIFASNDTDEEKDVKKPNDRRKVKKKHNPTNFSFGLTASPQYSYRKFNEYESNFRSIKDFRNQTDGSIFGYSFGLDLYYRISPFVYINTGIQYSRMGENIAVAHVDDNGVSKIIAAEDVRERNIYNYMDIPLALSVRINRNNRTKLDLKGGIVYSKLTKVNALLYDYTNDEYKSVIEKDAPQLNPDNVSLMFGVNAVVPLDNRDKHMLTLGPMVRYNMLSTFADTYTARQRNFSLGVQVSYIVRLDH